MLFFNQCNLRLMLYFSETDVSSLYDINDIRLNKVFWILVCLRSGFIGFIPVSGWRSIKSYFPSVPLAVEAYCILLNVWLVRAFRHSLVNRTHFTQNMCLSIMSTSVAIYISTCFRITTTQLSPTPRVQRSSFG